MKLFMVVVLFAALCAFSLGEEDEEEEDFDIPEDSKLTKYSKEPPSAGTRHSLFGDPYENCKAWTRYGDRCYKANKNECKGNPCLYETKVAYLKCAYGTYIKVPLVRYYYPPATQCNTSPTTWCRSCKKYAKCRTATCAIRVSRLFKVNQYYYNTEVHVPYPCCKCHY